MPDITWTHPNLHRVLNAIPTDTRSILDAGSGPGIIGALCRIYRECERVTAIDIHEPYLKKTRECNLYDEYLRRALDDLPLPFDDGEFDVATCIEVIEHLPTDVGLALLSELERVARRVVVTTPNRFFEQDHLDGNPYQQHLSLWRERDFKRRGYSVAGIGGMKIFGRRVKYLSAALGPLTLKAPRLSTAILAIKDRRGGRVP